MTKFQIQVTERDIFDGKKRNGTQCPVALAMNRALRMVMSPKTICEVGAAGVAFIHVDKDCYSVQLPKPATDFIREFDRSLSLASPTTFVIEVPPCPM